MSGDRKKVPKEVLRAFHELDEKTYTKNYSSSFLFPERLIVHRKKLYVIYLILGLIILGFYIAKPTLVPPYFMEVDLP